jgi:hypothetical protein
MANPNPNMKGLKPFTKGQSGNPSGLSSEMYQRIQDNARKAVEIRSKLLDAVAEKLGNASELETLGMVESAMLKLLQDAETRGLGAPVQPVDHTSTDGTMTPRDTSSAVLDALKRKHDDPK